MKNLPQPSYAPPLMAVGVMLVLWGAVAGWIVSAAGALFIGVAAFKWMK